MRIYSKPSKKRIIVTGEELIKLAQQEIPASENGMTYVAMMNGFGCGIEEFLSLQGRRLFVIDRERKPEDWPSGGDITKKQGWVKVWKS